MREYRERNLEKLLIQQRIYGKLYKKLNKSKINCNTRKRQAIKKKACPAWLTESHYMQMENFYWLAKDCEVVSGQKYHVDHIVPLQGKNVCGLHVPWNLQVLPEDINASKNNRYDYG